MAPTEDSARHGDGLERSVWNAAALEPEWQVPIDLPEMPRILLQARDGAGSWINYHARVVVADRAEPTPSGYHSTDDQLVATIAHVVTDGDQGSTEPESAVEDDQEETIDQTPEMEQTEQEGLDAFA